MSREVGARQDGAAQLAYGYHDRATREASTYLVDTTRRLQIRLPTRYESVKLIGWLSPQDLLIELNGQLARFEVGRGWHPSFVCAESPCTLMTTMAGEFVGTWQGRSGADLAPQWSPDHHRVALMRRIGNTFALLLYVTDTDGNASRLTRRGVLGLNYFWRPCPEVGCFRG